MTSLPGPLSNTCLSREGAVSLSARKLLKESPERARPEPQHGKVHPSGGQETYDTPQRFRSV
jgi:hypothetical protein